MAARANSAWEASLDPRLVARLARPLRRPGLVSLAIVRRIHGGIDALFGRLSLLARFAHKVRELTTPETPIVHAWGIGATTPLARVGEGSAPAREPGAPPPPLPIVRAIEQTIERTIIVEKSNRAEPSRSLDARPESIHKTDSAPGAVHRSPPVGPHVEMAGSRDRMTTAVGETRERIGQSGQSEHIEQRESSGSNESREPSPMHATIVPAPSSGPSPVRATIMPDEPSGPEPSTRPSAPPAAIERIERTVPPVRRSRMGAPIVRRATEPVESPVAVARAAAAARALAAASPTAPGDAAVVVPTRLPGMPPAVVVPAGAPDPGTPIVRPHRARLSPSRSNEAPGARSVDRAEVVVPRRSSTVSPDGAAVVHPIASRAPGPPLAASAATPAVLPRPRQVQPERERPLAHAAPRAPGPATEPTPVVPLAGVRAQAPLPVAHRDPVASPPPPRPAPKLDLHEIADQVQHILSRRDRQERERRGLPR